MRAWKIDQDRLLVETPGIERISGHDPLLDGQREELARRLNQPFGGNEPTSDHQECDQVRALREHGPFSPAVFQRYYLVDASGKIQKPYEEFNFSLEEYLYTTVYLLAQSTLWECNLEVQYCPKMPSQFKAKRLYENLKEATPPAAMLKSR